MVASLRTHWEFPFPLWKDPVLSCWVMRTMGKKLNSSCFPSSSHTLKRCLFFKNGTKLIYFVILYSPLSNSQSHCNCIILFLPWNFREFFCEVVIFHHLQQHCTDPLKSIIWLLFYVKAGHKPVMDLLKSGKIKNPHRTYMQPCIVGENNNEMCTEVSRTAVHAFPKSLGSVLQ